MTIRAGTKCLLIAAATALLFSVTSFDFADASTSYKVKKGDNIYDLAKKFKTTPAKIKEANDLNSNKLKIGRKLVIPSDKKAVADRSKNSKYVSKSTEGNKAERKRSDEHGYTVKKGDNIYDIAKKFKTTPAKIKEANDLNSNKLKIGRKLVIPSDKKVKVADAKEKKYIAKTEQDDSDRNSADAQTYRVQKRDNIARIAKKFKTTPAKIREANGLDSDKLKIGRKLVIPSDKKVKVASVKKRSTKASVQEDSDHKSPSERQTYTVKKGDNIYNIAKKFKTSSADIKEANDLDSDKLRIGRKLVIPSEKTVAHETVEKKHVAKVDSTEEKETPEHKASEEHNYTVHKGDSIAKIAKKFHTSTADIKSANDLNSDKVKAGEKLVIPSDHKTDTAHAAEDKHTVKATEQKKTADVSEITRVEARPIYKYHRVQRGETLKSISKKYDISVRDLIAINDIKIKTKKKTKKKKKTTNITVRAGQNLIVGNISGKTQKIQRVDISRKIENVKILSKSSELADMSATDRLLLFAKKMLDLPYKFGANGVMGVDCSSFVQRVYSFVDMKLPRSAREQFHVGQEIPKDELKSGDLIFFRTYARFPSHVGIYIGNNLFIHASSVSKKVTIDSINKPYYLQRYIGAKRLLTDTADKVEDAAAAIVTDTVNRY